MKQENFFCSISILFGFKLRKDNLKIVKVLAINNLFELSVSPEGACFVFQAKHQ